MNGQWRPAIPTSELFEEAITTMQVLSIQLLIVTATVRFAATITLVSVSLCTSSKILRALDARAKFHNQVNEQDMVIDIRVLQCYLMDLS